MIFVFLASLATGIAYRISRIQQGWKHFKEYLSDYRNR